MNSKCPKDVFDFVGVWSIERRIDDFRNQTQASLNGLVTFSPVPSDIEGLGTGDAKRCLTYLEVGQLQVGEGPALEARRKNHWCQKAIGDDIHVSFEDGRPFHVIMVDPPLQDAPSDTHFCDPDTYDLSYDFSDWPQWSLTCQVKGPRKNYSMVTRFRPNGG